MPRKPPKPPGKKLGQKLMQRKPWTRLEDEGIRRRYIQAISAGACHSAACDFAGVTVNSVNTWLDYGYAAFEKLDAFDASNGETEALESWEEEYLEFYKEVLEVTGACDTQLAGLIKKAAQDGDWKASAWLLERRRKEFNAKTVVDVTSNNTTYMKALHGQLTLDDEGITDADAIRIFLETSHEIEERYKAIEGTS